MPPNRSTAAHPVASTTIRASSLTPLRASAQKALTMRLTATTRSSSLGYAFAGAGSILRHANTGALRFPRSICRQAISCVPPPPSDPKSSNCWWMKPLSPEDLVEPTGQGLDELQAIWNALVQSPIRPVLLALQQIKATGGNIFRCRTFHAGLISGPLLLAAGFCQLYQVAPNLCVDIVLGYIYYKLSVLAAELKTNGKANNICNRLQSVLLVVLWFNGNNYNEGSYFFFTRFIWTFAFHVYSCSVLYECIGVKHPERCLEAIFETLLTTKGGVIKVLKFMLFGIE